jgi:regulator of sigma D
MSLGVNGEKILNWYGLFDQHFLNNVTTRIWGASFMIQKFTSRRLGQGDISRYCNLRTLRESAEAYMPLQNEFGIR